MKKAFLVIVAVAITLFTNSGYCASILDTSQYNSIKRLNDNFLGEYKKLSAIQMKLLDLQSYDKDKKYKDTWLDEAIEHVTLILNVWACQYGFIRHIPSIKDEFIQEYLCEITKRIELAGKKTIGSSDGFGTAIKWSIVQFSNISDYSALKTDILKELKNAQVVMEAGLNILDSIAAKFPQKVVCNKD
jgi:hypothetical protein